MSRETLESFEFGGAYMNFLRIVFAEVPGITNAWHILGLVVS